MSSTPTLEIMVTKDDHETWGVLLLEACREGSLVNVRSLLCVVGTDLLLEDDTWKSPLHYSCHHGWLDVTTRLVEQLLYDPDSIDWRGDTPLHEACREGHMDIVKYLVNDQRCSIAIENKCMW